MLMESSSPGTSLARYTHLQQRAARLCGQSPRAPVLSVLLQGTLQPARPHPEGQGAIAGGARLDSQADGTPGWQAQSAQEGQGVGQVPQDQGLGPAGTGQLQVGVSTVTMEVRGQVELAGAPAQAALGAQGPRDSCRLEYGESGWISSE